MATLVPDRILGHNVQGIKIGDAPTSWDVETDYYVQITGDEMQGIVKELTIRTITPDADIIQYLGQGTSTFDGSTAIANADLVVKRQGLVEIEMTVDHNEKLLELIGMPAIMGTSGRAYIGGAIAQYGNLKTLGIKIKTASGKEMSLVLADAVITLEGPKISADGAAEYTLTAKGLPHKFAVWVPNA